MRRAASSENEHSRSFNERAHAYALLSLDETTLDEEPYEDDRPLAAQFLDAVQFVAAGVLLVAIFLDACKNHPPIWRRFT